MVVLLSDGADTCKDKKKKAGNAIRSSNIPINTIGFDVGNNADAQRELQDLANMPREIRRVMIAAVMQGLLKPVDMTSNLSNSSFGSQI